MDIYQRKILTNIKNPDLQIQQNWIDITLNRVFELKDPLSGVCILSEETRVLPRRIEIEPTDWIFLLKKNCTYDIEFNEEVSIPRNMNGTLVQRSSLNRMWSTFSCGVYDSGYQWLIWGILRPSLDIQITKGTRCAQFVFTFADGNGLYDWKYQYSKSQK